MIVFQGLRRVTARRLLLILGIIISAIVVFQLFELPSANYILSLVPSAEVSKLIMTRKATPTLNSKSTNSYVAAVVANNTNISHLGEDSVYENEGNGADVDYDRASYDDGVLSNPFSAEDRNLGNFTFGRNIILNKNFTKRMVEGKYNISARERAVEFANGPLEKVKAFRNKSALEYDGNLNIGGKVRNGASSVSLPLMAPKVSACGMNLNADSRSPVLYVAPNMNLTNNSKQSVQTQLKDKNAELLKTVPITLNNISTKFINSTRRMRARRVRKKTTSISQMSSLFIQGLIASSSMKGRWSSMVERQLLSAKLHILNAPTVRNTPGLHAPLFRNVSIFKRSYELMERILKIYIYKEGEKPIFHQPRLRGIYASEGWFMKLMEGNKQFVSSPNQKKLEEYLKNYVGLIAEKYIFWNRTGGADHFLVACHDWAPEFTKSLAQNCIRALCNANVARGFKIGKDTTLPETNVPDEEDPLKNLGGKPPSQRPILAFFAGNPHGSLRPILLRYWENKEPDMKISGPMPRDSQGKKAYREYMRSSKYCISARGTSVHTPRVVEAIFYECVPVIISDNYVPPFFEVLDWETYAVFILQKDIPNLRNILLSISEEKYLAMQQRVRMVQRHFLWHKSPVKYDLFHMVLHSVWFSRVLQIKVG
ncbi:probable glycosyltransferase At3g07620 isoform X2 [Malania oleifera]|uniref:probable glycosyltransferase At3g07620 isoform X2 n=1 Tax=Malania oleifera TaxID=397392 RepID=UPI0025AE537D|nr:probable glycosyltransferase At3g07620 isoform X2 [Malania oleifera]XP_057969010.1 probable glycosyltransferase At3g07620 isoform X2 [Malania oleifera]XP_057969011.1 probable glycosyltransferase At3g07620 isoform X2 [Malania oleifera]